MGGLSGGDAVGKNEAPLGNRTCPVSEENGNEDFAESSSSQVEASEDSLRVKINWPQVTQDNALFQILSCARTALREGRGGYVVQRDRARELLKENEDPVKHVAASRDRSFPSHKKSHLPRNALEAVQFLSDN